MEGIGNTIGRFVAMEDDFHLAYDKRVARILTEMDISWGLPVEVEILCNERLLIQRLDYLHIPFRFSYCRSVDHLRNSCPHRFSRRNNLGIGDSRTPMPSASATEGQRPPLGNTIDSPSPTDVVSDSFLEVVDDLIKSHNKSYVPPLCSITILDSPPRSPLKALNPPLSSESSPINANFPHDSVVPSLLTCTGNS